MEKRSKILFADVVIGYIRNNKNFTRKLLQLINTFNKTLATKLVALLYTNYKCTEKNIRETTPFTIVSNNI